MKAKYILLIITAGLLLFISSCSESLLNIKEKATSDQADYFCEDVIDECIADVYWYWAYMGKTAWSIKSFMDDDIYTGGNVRNDNTGYEALNEKTWSASLNGGLDSYISGLYTLIYKAHTIIENFGDYMDNPDVRRGMAEAYFFRAYAYLELVSLWGTPPLVDHILGQSEYRTPNGNREALWALIVSDLEYAVNSDDLDEKVMGDPSTTIRISKQAAQALLGKALLYQATYDNPDFGNLNNGDHGWDPYTIDCDDLLRKAVTYLNAVVDDKQFKLIDDFSDLYHSEADYCDEYVMESNLPNSLMGTNDTWAFWYLNMSVVTTTWRWQGDVYSAGSDTELGSNYYTDGGYGFMQGITKQYSIDGDLTAPGLVDAFESSPGEANSQRRLWTYRTWSELETMGLVGNGTAYGTSGYFNMKRLFRLEGGTENFMGDMDLSDAYTYYAGSYANFPHMLYSEVLLMCAEANLLASTGSEAKALACVNEVRQRAGSTTYGVIDHDKIKLEYQLELACEGHRYQNLVRWGDAATVMAKQGLYLPFLQNGTLLTWYDNSVSNPGFKAGKNELLPFPADEFIVNPNLNQNPGY